MSRSGVASSAPLSTLLSQALVAFTIELDNEFERRFPEAGGGARVVSLTMWSNLLRFVGDGTTVGELVAAVGLPKRSALSRLGGVERWRYVSVGPATGKREGYGSARGMKDDWVVRFTPAGLRAAEIWPALPGRDRGALARAVRRRGDRRARRERYAPSTRPSTRRCPSSSRSSAARTAMALELPSVETRAASDDLSLVTLLAHALMAYTIDFEDGSPVSLPLSANVLRVLGETGVPVRELPSLAGVSKEAVEVSLTSLGEDGLRGRRGRARIEANGPRDARGSESSRRISVASTRESGSGGTRSLRASLERILDHPDLSAGLQPYPTGWRASKPYAQQTEAVLADPRGRLPHYPMVLHRGGWPDGS